jgi:hypothetical protein
MHLWKYKYCIVILIINNACHEIFNRNKIIGLLFNEGFFWVMFYVSPHPPCTRALLVQGRPPVRAAFLSHPCVLWTGAGEHKIGAVVKISKIHGSILPPPHFFNKKFHFILSSKK